MLASNKTGDSLNSQSLILSPFKQYVGSHASLMQALSGLRQLAYGSPTRGKIAMFHIGRCGSTVLAKSLGQHSQLHWGNEIFGDVNYLKDFGIQPTKRWVRSVIEFRGYRRKCEYFGFETKATHLSPYCLDLTIDEYVSLLRQLGFNHFIVLTRSNLLRVIVSAIIGGQTKKWHMSSVPSGPTRVTVNVNQPWEWWPGSGSIIHTLEIFDRYYANCALTLRDSNRLDLNYEIDIERDPSVGYKKVCNFLSIEPEPSDIRLTKTNPFRIEEMVINYDEVAAALHGTRFEWMLTA